MKNKNKEISIIIAMWIAVIVIFLFGTYLPKLISLPYIKFFEVASSWITVLCTLALGLLTALLVFPYSRINAILVTCAYSSIFICYIGYVTVDYGSFEPLVAAIGFNIATILQAVSIWKIAQMLKKS